MHRLCNSSYFGCMRDNGLPYPAIRAKINATHMVGMADLHILRPIQVLNDVQSVELYSLPLMRSKGVFMARVFAVQNGEILAMMNQVSMIVSMDSRKVMPTQEVCDSMGVDIMKTTIAAPRRLKLPEDMELVREHVVRYADCDINKHMNTGKYIDQICETLGYWEGRHKVMNRLRIEFNRECVPGDTLGLYVKRSVHGWYVKGVKNGTEDAFKAYVEMREAEDDA
jgi:acyl-ACP thioesterase